MNTEQLKQAALAATQRNWVAMPICKVSNWVDVVAQCADGRHSLPFVACKHFNAEANAAYIAAANPATILALLECVDALRRLMADESEIGDADTPEAVQELMERCRKARAALQKLEAL